MIRARRRKVAARVAPVKDVVGSPRVARDRRGERGSTTLVAILLLGILMAAGVAFAGSRVTAAKGQGQRDTGQREARLARSAAANVVSSLRADIPARYEVDLERARQMSGMRPLPAFDPNPVPGGVSRPVARINTSTGELEPAGNPSSSWTSLLGQVNTWAAARLKIAEDFAAGRGYGPDVVNVASLKESYRPVFTGSEQAYALEYWVDARGGETGRARPNGLIVLGPAVIDCGTVATLRAEPDTIVRGTGSASTLTVTYTNATRVKLTDSSGATVLDQAVPNDTNPRTLTTSVTPANTETYQATAYGTGVCAVETAPVTVTVQDPPCPQIRTFAANPPSTTTGGAVVISWDTADAAEVRLNGSVVANSGSITVNPAATTVYTLQAVGPGGWCPQAAQVTVTVIPCPEIEVFEAVPSSITGGTPEEATLRWNVLNAGSGVTVTLDGNPVAASGTLQVRPSATTTYNLRVTGPGGCPGQQAFATVTVLPPTCPDITTFTVTPDAVDEGDEVVAQWDVSNPSGVANVQLIGPGINQPVAASGTLRVRMPAQGTYTFTLRVTPTNGLCSVTSRDAQVTVRPVITGPTCPTVNSFSASASCVDPGAPVSLAWDLIDADTVTITASDGTTVATGLPLNGSLTVNPTGTTVYTVSGSRAGCSTVSRPATVEVSAPPAINSFAATPDTIRPGGTSTLTFSIAGAASATINGVAVNPAGGSLPVTPSDTTDYVLEAVSGGCNPRITSRTVRVNVVACPQPSITRFSANPPQVIAGGRTSLDWAVTNLDAGATVNISGPGLNVNVGATGPMDVTPPAAPGVYTYVLSATNPCDPGFTAQQSVTVEVVACPPPLVLSFTASPSSITQGAGGFIRLEWQTNDPSGSGVGVSISPGVGGGLPANGFVDISAPGVTTTYTLTATNGCGQTATAQVTVTVNSPPNCTRTPTTVSGNINNGGNGSVNWMQSGSVTTRVVGSNLLIDIAYQIVPQNGATINGITLAFGAGFSSYRTSTASHNITYNVGTPEATTFSPSPAQLINTGGGHPPGGYRVTGTLTVPLTTPLVNNTINLRPLVVGSSSMGQFEVVNPVMQGQFSNCNVSCVATVLGTVNSQQSSSFAYQYIEAGNCVTRLSNGDLVWNLSTAQAFAESGNVRHFAQLFDGGGRLLATIDQTSPTSIAVRGYNLRADVPASALPAGSGPPYRAIGQTSFSGMAGSGFWPTHNWDTSAPDSRPRGCTCN